MSEQPPRLHLAAAQAHAGVCSSQPAPTQAFATANTTATRSAGPSSSDSRRSSRSSRRTRRSLNEVTSNYALLGRWLPRSSISFCSPCWPRRECVWAVRFTIDSFSKKHLQQRLVGHVTFVGESLQLRQKCSRQSQRDRLGGRLEIGEYRHPGLAPVDERARIVRLPERPFFSLRAKRRNGFTSRSLGHDAFSLDDSWAVLKSLEAATPG